MSRTSITRTSITAADIAHLASSVTATPSTPSAFAPIAPQIRVSPRIEERRQRGALSGGGEQGVGGTRPPLPPIWPPALLPESRETFLRDEAKLIINWKQVSNGGRKPTGAAGGKSDRILCCINIQRRINAKSGAVIMGASSADNNESNDDSSLEPSIIETAVDGGTDQEPPPFVIATPSIITGTNMPTAATSVAASAARRSSQTRTPTPTSFNAAKTKNSSNKERGSVLKSIDKLTASMDGGGGGGSGDQSMMSMLAMQMQQNAQSQFMQQQMFQQQFQMQMGQMTKEIKKGNNLTGKLVNAIAKKMSGKKRRKKVDSGDSSSSDGEDSHSSGDD
jgi:hypothetical protein